MSPSGGSSKQAGHGRLSSKPCKLLPSSSPAAARLLFELSAVELIELVGAHLQHLVDENDDQVNKEGQRCAGTTRFHTRKPPSISLSAYLKRLLQLSPFPLDALLLGVVYICRLTRRPALAQHVDSPLPVEAPNKPSAHSLSTHSNASPQFTVRDPVPITSRTCHRLILAALAVAAKYTSDAYITPKRLAKAGGVEPTELHELELAMFAELCWDCFVAVTELETVCTELVLRHRSELLPAQPAPLEACTSWLSATDEAGSVNANLVPRRSLVQQVATMQLSEAPTTITPVAPDTSQLQTGDVAVT